MSRDGEKQVCEVVTSKLVYYYALLSIHVPVCT